MLYNLQAYSKKVAINNEIANKIKSWSIMELSKHKRYGGVRDGNKNEKTISKQFGAYAK